jgi:RNA polymerase sigma-70 factor (ECF subfamily)
MRCLVRKEQTLPDRISFDRFERAVLPHLGAAYNLARWLTRNNHDAEDVVQEAYLRALQFFDRFHGTDGRAWLLMIVRNTCYTWLQKNRPREGTTVFDEALHSDPSETARPEVELLRNADKELLRHALEALPVEFREILVLRELEELSYKEIAQIASLPLGTVMSRLARAREQLRRELARHMNRD